MLLDPIGDGREQGEGGVIETTGAGLAVGVEGATKEVGTSVFCAFLPLRL